MVKQMKPIKGVMPVETGRPRQPESVKGKTEEHKEEPIEGIGWFSEPGAVESALKRGDLDVKDLNLDDYKDPKDGAIYTAKLEELAINLAKANAENLYEVNDALKVELDKVYQDLLEDADEGGEFENMREQLEEAHDSLTTSVEAMAQMEDEMKAEEDEKSAAAAEKSEKLQEEKRAQAEQIAVEDERMAALQEAADQEEIRMQAPSMMMTDAELDTALKSAGGSLNGITGKGYRKMQSEYASLQEELEDLQAEVNIQTSGFVGFFRGLFNTDISRKKAEIQAMQAQVDEQAGFIASVEGYLRSLTSVAGSDSKIASKTKERMSDRHEKAAKKAKNIGRGKFGA